MKTPEDPKDDLFVPGAAEGQKEASIDCPVVRDKSQTPESLPNNPMDKIAFED